MSSEKTSAQLCRENGWGKGTVLEGALPPFYGYYRKIRIEAVGKAEVLACSLATRRRGSEEWADWPFPEQIYDLTVGTWKAVAAEPVAGGEEGLSELFSSDLKCMSAALADIAQRLFDIEMKIAAEKGGAA